MGLTIQRLLGPPTALEPGQYTRATGATIVCCPLCDAIEPIGETYTIDTSGRVMPAWVCPHCPCVEHLVLESFSEEVV